MIAERGVISQTSEEKIRSSKKIEDPEKKEPKDVTPDVAASRLPHLSLGCATMTKKGLFLCSKQVLSTNIEMTIDAVNQDRARANP